MNARFKGFPIAQTGLAEIGEVMDINGKEAVVMCLPLREEGKLIGAVGKVMFRDVQDLRTLAERLDLLENKLKLQHWVLCILKAGRWP